MALQSSIARNKMLHSKNATPVTEQCNAITNMKTVYRQRLPHIQPVGAAFFVTFRLFGSVSKTTIQKLKDKFQEKINRVKKLQALNVHQKNHEIFNLKKQYLVEYDTLLDKIKSGPMYLQENAIREIIKEQLHRFDNELYILLCYCIMSNHVHILIDTNIQLSEMTDDTQIDANYKQLDEIMRRIKGPSAWYSNKFLNRKGQFWDRESYDIYIRNEKMLNNVISYILENPVKSNIIDKWEEYPGNYLKTDS